MRPMGLGSRLAIPTSTGSNCSRKSSDWARLTQPKSAPVRLNWPNADFGCGAKMRAILARGRGREIVKMETPYPLRSS